MPDPCPPDRELDRLDEEQLLAELVAFRDSGRPECVKRVMAVLAFGRWDQIRLRVQLKVPKQDAEDVAAAVLESALRSSFDGRMIGEFVSWLNTIMSRRIADYHESNKRRPPVRPLADEHRGGDDGHGRGAELVSEGEEQAIAVREAAGRVLERRSEIHQMAIRLYGPGALGHQDLSAREVATRIEATHPGSGMSEANVHQIYRRFKAELNRELGMGGS